MKLYKSNVSEFGLKYKKSEFRKAKIQSSKDAADYIRQFYFDDLMIYESFFMVMLNRGNNTTGFVKISQGGISGTVVDVKLIAKYAIESLACSVIVAHNHPSGTLTPSDQDVKITRKIREALTLFDIQVLDHVILAEDKHYSFADEGII